MTVESVGLMELAGSVAACMIMAVPSAWLAWLWTKEEFFREPQEWVRRKRDHCRRCFDDRTNVRTWLKYKACYALTCETCFSHYPAMFFTAIAGSRLVLPGFLGWFLAWMFTSACENLLITFYSKRRIERRVLEEREKFLQHARKSGKAAKMVLRSNGIFE